MLRPMLGEAWHAMGANRMRTALTMLGMVIGVGSVVLMMAIGQGAQYAVAQTISTMGSNLYVIVSGWTQQSGVRTGSGFGYTLKIGDSDAITELDDIIHVAPVHQGTQQVVYGPKNWSTSVVGTSPSYLDARSWALSSGYPFDETDVRSATRVAIVGITVVENLFDPGEEPIGKTIRINNTPFEIIGTLGAKGRTSTAATRTTRSSSRSPPRSENFSACASPGRSVRSSSRRPQPKPCPASRNR